jgi:serine/threonine protein kinase
MGQGTSVEHTSGSLEDRYHLQKVNLGKGSFGSVWRGVDKNDQSLVAVKQLNKKTVRRNEIDREVAMMEGCKHENILRLLKTYEDERVFSLVLELCTEGDFGDKVKERGASMQEAEVAEWSRQIIGAIATLNARRICHRDIKPDNFLCKAVPLNSGDKAIQLKLSDFGLSVYIPPGGPLLKQKCGTPAFMAPEVHNLPDQSRGYSFPVDIWAAGVTLCLLMCAGQHPFITSSGQIDSDALKQGNRKLDFKGRRDSGIFGGFFSGDAANSDIDCRNNFSDAARSLCCQMVEPDERRRITPDVVLQHGWFQQQHAVSCSAVPQPTVGTTAPAVPASGRASSEPSSSNEVIALRQEALALRASAREASLAREEAAALRNDATRLREKNQELNALLAELQRKSEHTSWSSALHNSSVEAHNAEVSSLRNEITRLRQEAIAAREAKEFNGTKVVQPQKREESAAVAPLQVGSSAEVKMLREEAMALRETNKALDALVNQLRADIEKPTEVECKVAERDEQTAVLRADILRRDADISELREKEKRGSERTIQLEEKVGQQDEQLKRLYEQLDCMKSPMSSPVTVSSSPANARVKCCALL